MLSEAICLVVELLEAIDEHVVQSYARRGIEISSESQRRPLNEAPTANSRISKRFHRSYTTFGPFLRQIRIQMETYN
jgi:hypothetical protein